jgi:hypothetical protein
MRGVARKGAVAQCGSGTPRGAADAPDTTVVATRVTRVTRYDDESAHAGRSQGRRRGPLGRGGGTGCRGARRRGFPARFALAFADLQLQPPDIDEALWQEAVDAMGRQLDRARDLADTGNTGING